jgi:hypothetical protein
MSIPFAVFEYLGWCGPPNKEELNRLNKMARAGRTVVRSMDQTEVPVWDMMFQRLISCHLILLR